MDSVNEPLCNYSMGDPFNGQEVRECLRPAIKAVDWGPVNEGWGQIFYCRRHWEMAKEFVMDQKTPVTEVEWNNA